jgi:hypothetical protein
VYAPHGPVFFSRVDVAVNGPPPVRFSPPQIAAWWGQDAPAQQESSQQQAPPPAFVVRVVVGEVGASDAAPPLSAPTPGRPGPRVAPAHVTVAKADSTPATQNQSPDARAALPVTAAATKSEQGDLTSLQAVRVATARDGSAADLVDAADGTPRASALSAAPSGLEPRGPADARTAAPLSGGTMIATMTLPATTTFGMNAAVSPPVSGEVPAGVAALANDSLAVAARWAAEGLGLEAGIELGAADGEGSWQAGAMNAVRLFLPAQVLGLAPAWAPGATTEDQPDGKWGWKVTAVLSLAATLTGYWYCNRVTPRRRQAGHPPVQPAWRLLPGAHPAEGGDTVAL